jgi:hypothetical protein
MGQNKNKPFYFPPELKDMILCQSVLLIVLKENTKAKELYADVKKCCELPGCKDSYDIITYLLPDGLKILQKSLGDSSTIRKGKPSKNNPFDLSNDVRKGTKKIINKYHSRPRVLIWLNNTKRRDLNKLRSSISTFIRMGFNRASEQDEGKYRVNGSVQSSLATTILLPELITKLYGNTEAIEKRKLLKHGKKVILSESNNKLYRKND